MRAISLWQPWATLIAIGAKHYETRSWGTSYRGPLALHAAKETRELELCETTWFQEALQAAGIQRAALPLGAIIGTFHLDGCLRIAGAGVGRAAYGLDPRGLSSPERAFGNWEPGRYAWHVTSVVRFAEPIPFRGAQGLFDVPSNVLAQARAFEDRA